RSGTYRPTKYPGLDMALPIAGHDVLLTPERLSVFDGADPNGTWRLWVSLDSKHVHVDSWALRITTPDPLAAPNVISQEPAQTTDGSYVTFTGTARPESTVLVTGGGLSRSTAPEAADGNPGAMQAPWTVTVGPLEDGVYEFDVVQTDQWGN